MRKAGGYVAPELLMEVTARRIVGLSLLVVSISYSFFGFSAGSWMGLIIDLGQMLKIQMGIYLGGGNIGMA